MIEVRRFVTESGTDVVGRWLLDLNDERARAKINIRIARLALGNLGDCKSLGKGLFELRIDYGPGYRLYFARIDPAIVLLLCGGDKRRQSVDIDRATTLLQNYHKRNS
jgi:putative addiction module killer protein